MFPSMSVLTTSHLQLRIVPVGALQLHEEDDPNRVKRLITYLQRDKKLRNPIVVAEQKDKPGSLVVLDGATRVSALREMEIPDAIIQIVDYFSPWIELKVWHHVVVGFPSHRILSGLNALSSMGVTLMDNEQSQTELARRRVLACLTLSEGQNFAISHKGDLYDEADRLCELVAIYRGKAEVHRTAEIERAALLREYPDLTTIVSFPPFTPAEILKIAANGKKVPMGITRHLIAGRALGLGIPLKILAQSDSLEAKNDWLDQQVRMRLRANKIRLYQEPVFIFDD
jgi:hypothetical protein